MGLTTSSLGGVSDTQRSSKLRKTSGKGLLRKMTIAMKSAVTKGGFSETMSEISGKSGKGKKKKVKRNNTTGAGADFSNTLARKDMPQDLNLAPDIPRPHEQGIIDGQEIEVSIDQKRKRVNIEAIHRAEKAKQQTNMFGVAGVGRKGGIPTTKLRGINEADFFQKNNSVEKGFTFNSDGSLIDFKKPKITKELESSVQYEVPNEILVKEALGKNHKKKGSGSMGGFGAGGTRMTQTDYGASGGEKMQDKQGGTHYSRQNTQKETPKGDKGFETATSMQFLGAKQGVIEFNHVAPSKVMTIEQGVELIEKGKVSHFVCFAFFAFWQECERL